MVRLYRTCSSYIVTGETRCAGRFCTRSGWFKPIEPPRTLSNHLITELASCVQFVACSRTGSTLLQGEKVERCVLGGLTVPNLLYLLCYRGSMVCRCTGGLFGGTQHTRLQTLDPLLFSQK